MKFFQFWRKNSNVSLKGMSIVIYEKIAEKNLIEVKFLMFLLIVDMP